jgi:cell division protease FtsH
MVTRLGDGKLGLVAFKTDDHQPFLGYDLSQGRDYSETTAAKIDEEVERLLRERHKAVYELLTGEREKLEHLVKALLHEETLGQDALAEILGPRPEAPSQNRDPVEHKSGTNSYQSATSTRNELTLTAV